MTRTVLTEVVLGNREWTNTASLLVNEQGRLSARLDDETGVPIFEETLATFDDAEALFTEWAGVVIRDALAYTND